MEVSGSSSDPNTAAVTGINSVAGDGVLGQGGKNGVKGITSSSTDSGVVGENDAGGSGVWGNSVSGAGVFGTSKNADGILGQGAKNGVKGITSSSTDSGVVGENDAGEGVVGDEPGGSGVWGNSVHGAGVFGTSKNADGILGQGAKNGVKGITSSSTDSGVVGENDAGGSGVWGNSVSGAGVFATSKTGISLLAQGGSLAARFEGNVEVTGDIQLTGGDCAEHFDVLDAAGCDPGTLMVIDDSGALMQSHQEYDHRVAGVIAGAGDLRPGIVLDARVGTERRRPIALVGKVFCKAIADGAAIAVGDLLTSSGVAGHAMKASDPSRAFGAVIGKALRPLVTDHGLIPILVALQ